MIPKFKAYDRVRGLMEVVAMSQNFEVLTLQNEDYSKYLAYTDDVRLFMYSDMQGYNGEQLAEGDLCYDHYDDEHGVVVFNDGKFQFEYGGVCEDLIELHESLIVVGNVCEFDHNKLN